MSATSIEWAIGPDGSRGHTVNPIRFRNLATGKVGHYCEKIASGCKNCYSSTMQKPYLSGLEFVASNRDKGKLFFEGAVLDQVLRRRKPTGFFWCDMTDLFGSWVPDEWIDNIIGTIWATPSHRHYVLTKRSQRAAEFLPRLYAKWDKRELDAETAADCAGRSFDCGPEIPPRNLWVGASASTSPDLDDQIEYLRATPAAVRFLSLEPLIADLGTIDLSGIGWVIVGGESGPGARPCQVKWIRSVVRQCAAARTPCFVKQLGAVVGGNPAEFSTAIHDDGDGHRTFRLLDRKGGNPAEWPIDLQVRQLPGGAQ